MRGEVTEEGYARMKEERGTDRARGRGGGIGLQGWKKDEQIE